MSYCAAEDSWQHTIVPRLIAARADLNLVYRIDVESIEIDTGASMVAQLTLPCDCDLLAGEIKRLEVAMVALDPLMSVIDTKLTPITTATCAPFWNRWAGSPMTPDA